MNSIQEKALYHLTGFKDLSLVNEETLVKLADNYPYFAPVQMLLSAKYKTDNSSDFIKQVQKTSLYFTNPYWLHYLIQEKPNQSLLEDYSPVSIDYLLENPDAAITRNNYGEIEELPETKEAILEKELPKNNNDFSNIISIPTIESVKEMMRGIDKQTFPETALDENSEEEITKQPDFHESESIHSHSEPYNEEAATDLSNSKISSLLSNQLADFKKPVQEEEELEISREPMYTIDYFASQGIKIDLSKIPQDKLTTHLRRFTDWLKYMKHDNPNPIDLGTNQDLEEAVEMIAKTSNEQREIVTETMADVLQKQGQLDKAIQLYIKLSFLNPEKSAYFASKIQHLKGIQ